MQRLHSQPREGILVNQWLPAWNHVHLGYHTSWSSHVLVRQSELHMPLWFVRTWQQLEVDCHDSYQDAIAGTTVWKPSWSSCHQLLDQLQGFRMGRTLWWAQFSRSIGCRTPAHRPVQCKRPVWWWDQTWWDSPTWRPSSPRMSSYTCYIGNESLLYSTLLSRIIQVMDLLT